MNETDRWIYFDGPPPPSVKRLLDALRHREPPRPSPEQKARVIGSFVANFDAWIARARAAPPDDAPAGDERRSDVYPVSQRPPLDAPAIAKIEEARPALDFEAWAALSFRLLGATEEEKAAAAGALGLTIEAWTRLDEAYLRALSDDLIAGRMERPALYRAACQAEMARRQEAAGGEAAKAKAEAGKIEAAGGEPAGAVPVPSGEAASVPAPRLLKSTAEAVDLPPGVRELMGRLPFLPAAPAGAAPAKAAAAKTLQARIAPSAGTTMPLDGDVIQKAVAAVPFVGSAGGAGAGGVVSFPSFTVRQYFSLRMDLAAHPDQAADTLRKYGVPNEAARRALDEHWRERMAASPELRAAWEEAAAEYTSWERMQQRR
jgi:hypothetical protein